MRRTVKIVIDGSNMAHLLDKGRPSLTSLLVARDRIRVEYPGADINILTDGNFIGIVEKRGTNEERVLYRRLVKYNEIVQVPEKADSIVLQFARQTGALVVSNDKFRDRPDLRAGLARLSITVVGGLAILEDEVAIMSAEGHDQRIPRIEWDACTQEAKHPNIETQSEKEAAGDGHDTAERQLKPKPRTDTRSRPTSREKAIVDHSRTLNPERVPASAPNEEIVEARSSITTTNLDAEPTNNRLPANEEAIHSDEAQDPQEIETPGAFPPGHRDAEPETISLPADELHRKNPQNDESPRVAKGEIGKYDAHTSKQNLVDNASVSVAPPKKESATAKAEALRLLGERARHERALLEIDKLLVEGPSTHLDARKRRVWVTRIAFALVPGFILDAAWFAATYPAFPVVYCLIVAAMLILAGIVLSQMSITPWKPVLPPRTVLTRLSADAVDGQLATLRLHYKEIWNQDGRFLNIFLTLMVVGSLLVPMNLYLIVRTVRDAL